LNESLCLSVLYDEMRFFKLNNNNNNNNNNNELRLFWALLCAVSNLCSELSRKYYSLNLKSREYLRLTVLPYKNKACLDL
jgi:hypothetical protein